MKGIVFALLQQVVTEEYGEGTWDALLEAASLEGAYTAVGTYPDDELFRLVGAASETLGLAPDDIVAWFGRNAMPLLHARYPQMFEGHTSVRSFVLTLNDVIHPEVRKLFPGAYVPEFEFDDSRPDGIDISYSSHRRLCSFAEGLIKGAADRYGEIVEVVHVKCMKKGDHKCVLSCTFRRAA